MRIKKKKTILLILFFIYIMILLYLTVIRIGFRYNERQLNLTLFANLIHIWRSAGTKEFLIQFLGNIGWFIPFGFLLPLIMKIKNPFTIIGLGVMFSLGIELIQFFALKGVADIDDLTLNTFGTAIGYLAYRILRRLHMMRKTKKT